MRLLGVVLTFVVAWFVLLIAMGAIGNFGTGEVLVSLVLAGVVAWALSRYYDKHA